MFHVHLQQECEIYTFQRNTEVAVTCLRIINSHFSCFGLSFPSFCEEKGIKQVEDVKALRPLQENLTQGPWSPGCTGICLPKQATGSELECHAGCPRGHFPLGLCQTYPVLGPHLRDTLLSTPPHNPSVPPEASPVGPPAHSGRFRECHGPAPATPRPCCHPSHPGTGPLLPLHCPRCSEMDPVAARIPISSRITFEVLIQLLL